MKLFHRTWQIFWTHVRPKQLTWGQIHKNLSDSLQAQAFTWYFLCQGLTLHILPLLVRIFRQHSIHSKVWTKFWYLHISIRTYHGSFTSKWAIYLTATHFSGVLLLFRLRFTDHTYSQVTFSEQDFSPWQSSMTEANGLNTCSTTDPCKYYQWHWSIRHHTLLADDVF